MALTKESVANFVGDVVFVTRRTKFAGEQRTYVNQAVVLDVDDTYAYLQKPSTISEGTMFNWDLELKKMHSIEKSTLPLAPRKVRPSDFS